MKRTPLYETHVSLGAKVVPFAGWEMPVRYTSEITEHNCVRNVAGIFDVSHMGEIFVTGKEAEKAINYLTCNDVQKIGDGKALYSAILNEKGGIVDDIIIYRYSRERYLICVNAGNADKDFAWFLKHNKFDAVFDNQSEHYGQIALQGPLALKFVGELAGGSAATQLKRFHFAELELEGIPVIAARTGYSGEDGHEFFVAAQQTAPLWQVFIDRFTAKGLLPCGLAARDSLRLEACYPLHGHELAEDISALESELAWIVNFDKGDFIGREALLKQKQSGIPRTLLGFFVTDPGIVREGASVSASNGQKIGHVTSGTKTPTLGRSLGLALVKSEYARLGMILLADVRGKNLKCEVVARPFYKAKALSKPEVK